MGTRYVWRKYNQKNTYDRETTKATTYSYTYRTSSGDYTSNPPAAQSANMLGLGPKTSIDEGAWFSASSAYWDIQNTNGTYTQDHNFLIIKNEKSVYATNLIYSKIALERDYTSSLWNIKISNGQITITLGNQSQGGTGFTVYKNPTRTISQGDYLEDVSSSSSTSHPQDGADKYYYYVYKGSDNIDPTSVSYSKQNIEAGDSITITAATRTPVYGGTIYYQFSYSLNGGSTWTNIGSKSTTASASLTIPATANGFQARVVASDDLGFTSSSYVYGAAFVLNESPLAPASLTIPEDVYEGSSFIISWTASEDPDGNLSGYELERTYDNTSNWSQVSSSITGTSITDIIENGHTSVQYRVRARDAHGLLSAWTYSNTALIGQMKAFATVSGLNRAGVKMYATVGGKIREIQKGYATIGGKVRKMF